MQQRQTREGALSHEYVMLAGEGSASYAQNSLYQRGVVDAAKEKIENAIKLAKLDLSADIFRIADLGCSTGPNAFVAVQNIIEAIKLEYEIGNHNQNSTQVLEFQVFFNDHTENDFNTLFKTLPLPRPYFACGVPGNFYNRLFPTSSINFAHSSYALHWLSKIPKEVQDINSAAWNKNSFQCTGLVKEVVVAYEAQYKKDVAKFLRARAQEIVHGGLMVIVAPGLPDGVITVQSWHGVVIEFISTCLIDMTKSGFISVEKMNYFNLPMYLAHASELKEAIEENKSFSIERMESFTNPTKDVPQNMESVLSMYRAAFDGVIKAYFGHDIGDKLFQYCAEKIVNFPPDLKECHINEELFFVLRRI